MRLVYVLYPLNHHHHNPKTYERPSPRHYYKQSSVVLLRKHNDSLKQRFIPRKTILLID